MAESVRLVGFTRLDRLGLAVLGLFSAASVAGFASFGLNPQLLARFPSSAWFYAPAFQIFARGHVAIAFLVLAYSLTARVGARWLPALLVAGGVSLGAELLGTATGFPFGGYRYTPLLGYRVAGLVPFLIPFSWFMMAFPSYVLARHAARGRLARWMLGAILLTTWDLTLDPAMSSLTSYWVWESAGPWYGMPLVNLVGWLATSLVIMAGFDAVRAGSLADRIPTRLMAAYYATVLALSVAMTLAAGYWWAVLATLAILLVVWKGGRT
ncbi:carotenoid biosynthesis protein [Candidatus Palauibacter sp.]|uniref:carotenoid biosynthesis protein n=1 Tax=Candidatus Palauibacter sp. TaxID=3101350 RepID=UPI003B02433D